MREKLSMWKLMMNQDINKKSAWINKKGICLTPSVIENEVVTCARQEGVGSLFRYWSDFWKEQGKWDEETLGNRVNEITDVLRPHLQQHSGLALFRKRLRLIYGCPGPDD